MLSSIKSAFDFFLSIWGIWILFALGATLFLRYLSKRPIGDIELVEKCLTNIDKYVSDKFGDKASIIINCILQGLDAIKDGEFTDQEMLEEFIRIIKVKTAEKIETPLTEEQNKAIEEIGLMTLSSMSDKNKRKIAFQILSNN